MLVAFLQKMKNSRTEEDVLFFDSKIFFVEMDYLTEQQKTKSILS